MRHFIFLMTLVLAGYMASASPIDQLELESRPSSVEDIFVARLRRSDQYAKGRKPAVGSVKNPAVRPDQPLEFNLRKGEYICGGKVCKLQPGDKTCPMCQRPIL